MRRCCRSGRVLLPQLGPAGPPIQLGDEDRQLLRTWLVQGSPRTVCTVIGVVGLLASTYLHIIAEVGAGKTLPHVPASSDCSALGLLGRPVSWRAAIGPRSLRFRPSCSNGPSSLRNEALMVFSPDTWPIEGAAVLLAASANPRCLLPIGPQSVGNMRGRSTSHLPVSRNSISPISRRPFLCSVAVSSNSPAPMGSLESLTRLRGTEPAECQG